MIEAHSLVNMMIRLSLVNMIRLGLVNMMIEAQSCEHDDKAQSCEHDKPQSCERDD